MGFTTTVVPPFQPILPLACFRINIVAFAVVRRENEKSYKYLLTQAKKSKQITKFLNNKTTTCFTDGQNGVDAAVAELMPLAALQNCLEHLLREAGRVGKVNSPLVSCETRRGMSRPTAQRDVALCCTICRNYIGTRNKVSTLGQHVMLVMLVSRRTRKT